MTETIWPATMLWHVVLRGSYERRHVTYGDAGRTTTVHVIEHWAVAADDSDRAGDIAASRTKLTYPVVERVDAVQSGAVKMREGR